MSINAGIQLGQIASSETSRRIDTNIRLAVKEILLELEFSEFTYRRKLPKSLIPGECGACQPDGGSLSLNNTIVVAFEGKTQKREGNAIERWGKNRGIIYYVSPLASYITICAGTGTEEGGPIYNLAMQELAKEGHPGELNQFHNGNSSFYIVDHQISIEAIKNIIRPILRKFWEHFFGSTREMTDCSRYVKNKKKFTWNITINAGLWLHHYRNRIGSLLTDDIFSLSNIETHGVKYIGSKKKIVDQIGWLIQDLDIKSAIDVFSGTTRVAQYLRQRGISMITSDLAWATTCYAHTYVHNLDNRHLKTHIEIMNSLDPCQGWLSENYTGDTDQTAQRGEGRCFQLKNAMKADAARDWIDTQTGLTLWEKMTLITSVINALDAVDNTVGVQQAYLKEWCDRSSNDIVFKLPSCVKGPIGKHIEGDALKINYPTADLAYLDPPYSPHSYATYYHIWDSIAKWDKPQTTLKARRRVDRVAKHADFDSSMDSMWNHPKQAVDAFDTLIGRLPVRYVMISYNDESIVSEKELERVCRQHGTVKKNLIDYKRNIMSQVGNATKDGRSVKKNQMNSEILFLIEKTC